MALYRNTSPQRLVFAGITDPATGRTLVLDPGGEVDLPEDPGHPLLVAGGPSEEARVKALTGPEVDAELRDAGLPTTGKVPVRQARLLAHLSGATAEE